MTDGLGLGDAYDATLSRIKGQGGERSRLGMAALMWISHAERPLKPDELCHALAVEIGSPNFNIDNVPSIGTLLSRTCCRRKGGFHGPVNPLYPSRIPPGSSRARWYCSFDNGGNLLKLFEFAAGQGFFD